MVARTSFSSSSGESGCGRKVSSTAISCFSFAASSGAAALLKLLDGIAAFLHFLLHDGDDVGVRQVLGLALDLRVAERGLEQAEGGKPVGVPGEHGGLDFPGDPVL